MNSDIESAVASVCSSQFPGFADLIRRLKNGGAEKSEVVRAVTQRAGESKFVRNCLLITVDEIWSEPTST
jgi:hypothetical protein